MKCPFCHPDQGEYQQSIVLANEDSLFLQIPQEVLIGSGVIIPKAHRETVFDLTEVEWRSTYSLLKRVKELLDERYHPQGYNFGWNSGSVAGQEVFHAHMHVIPRFQDEPYAGKGMRYWLKQPENKRNADNS